jgi:hypothetical protein
MKLVKRMTAAGLLAIVVMVGQVQMARATTAPANSPPVEVDCKHNSSAGNYIETHPPTNVYAFNRTAGEDWEQVWWRPWLQVWDSSTQKWFYPTNSSTAWRYLGQASDTRGISVQDWGFDSFINLPAGWYYRTVYELHWGSNGFEGYYTIPATSYYTVDSLNYYTATKTPYCRF